MKSALALLLLATAAHLPRAQAQEAEETNRPEQRSGLPLGNAGEGCYPWQCRLEDGPTGPVSKGGVWDPNTFEHGASPGVDVRSGCVQAAQRSGAAGE